MTVNIGLVTSDAVILGCDSVASTTGHYLDPFALDWEKDGSGGFKKDKDGRLKLSFNISDLQPIVTNAWGGVTKLFEVHPKPSPMIAVTAGLAKLNDRPIASLGGEFFASHEKRTQKLIRIDVIARSFLEFMRTKYDEHYSKSKMPDSLKEGPEFLLGGFGRDDDFPSLFRVDVQNNEVVKEFGPNGGAGITGVSWNGQADAVERFIRGYDGVAKVEIESVISGELTKHNRAVTKYVTETINSVLDKLKQPMPSGININIPELKEIVIDWKKFRIDMDYANLPLQEAVNFASFLVLMQEGKARFARGVPTVGGRTHIGVITKDKGFRMLNEPELTHQYTGFADDH